MIRTRLLVSWLLAVSAATNAFAHTIWIEPNADGSLIVRFAEPDGKFEKSPGHLDALSIPSAFTLITNTPTLVEAPKKSDHFQLVGASAAKIAGVETAFTVRAGRKPYFYARWQPVGADAATPLLTLDLVPTGQPGEVRVWLRGKPLGGNKLTLRTPDEKEQELTANADGFVRFKTEQSGQYLLTLAHHREPIPGFHLGRAFEQTSHNAALTWRQP